MVAGIRSLHLGPWPYDIIVFPPGYPSHGVGLLLELPAPNSQADFLSQKKVDPLERVIGSVYEYSVQSPFIERTAAIADDLALGSGEYMQKEGPLKRHYYAINVDTSIRGMAFKAANFVGVTPAGSAGPINGFAEHIVAGTRRVVMLSGTQLFTCVGDPTVGANWNLSFTHTQNLYKARRWKAAGVTPVDALYIGTGSPTNSQPWLQWSGATITTAPVTLPVNANAMARYRASMWILDGANATIRQISGDPTVGGNYGPVYQVGSLDSVGVNVEIVGDVQYVFKDSGVYGMNSDGTSRDEAPGLFFQRDTTLGQSAFAIENNLYFNATTSLQSIDTSATLTNLGPDRLVENRSEVQGLLVAAVPYKTWFVYAALYNPANGNSYINKFGSWLNVDINNPSEWKFEPVWNLGYKKFANKRITALHISDADGTPRLYVGFADGTVSSCVLPRWTPLDLGDPNCRYTLDDGWLYSPLWHANWQADIKRIGALSVYGPHLTPAEYIDMWYANSAEATLLQLPGSFNFNPGTRFDVPKGVTSFGKIFQFAWHFINTTTANTPVMSGSAVHFRVRPSMMLNLDTVVRALAGVRDKAGRPYNYSPRYIRDMMRTIAENPDTTTIQIPSGEIIEMAINEYKEAMVPGTNHRAAAGWRIPIVAVQYQTFTLFGQVQRMNLHTVAELSSFAVASLQTI